VVLPSAGVFKDNPGAGLADRNDPPALLCFDWSDPENKDAPRPPIPSSDDGAGAGAGDEEEINCPSSPCDAVGVVDEASGFFLLSFTMLEKGFFGAAAERGGNAGAGGAFVWESILASFALGSFATVGVFDIEMGVVTLLAGTLRTDVGPFDEGTKVLASTAALSFSGVVENPANVVFAESKRLISGRIVGTGIDVNCFFISTCSIVEGVSHADRGRLVDGGEKIDVFGMLERPARSDPGFLNGDCDKSRLEAPSPVNLAGGCGAF